MKNNLLKKKSRLNFIQKIISKDLKNKKCDYIQTRFPPEPNGFLHIGHAKSIHLNFSVAKKYDGICNLRFDDTNPKKENAEYIDIIKSNIKWLGFKWKKIYFTSQNFEKIYQYAIKLIQKNLAYVDQLSKEEIKQYRGTLSTPGRNSPFRNQTIQENLILFEKMKSGYFSEGSACLRAKIDMSSPFIIMRDPVLYRIMFIEHHQTKKKWCIYPLYDFSHCISDALEGVTHSLCTLEFQENRELYNWILKNIDSINKPMQYEYSRLNLEYSILSKRKLSILVEKKIVSGWDDPRMPTISGLKKRGYTPNSIQDFCNRIGFTKKEHYIELDLLENCIRNDLNKSTPRSMAVINPIKLIISNIPENYKENIFIPYHPKNHSMGTNKITLSKEIYIDKSDFSEYYIPGYKRLILGKKVKLRYSLVIKAVEIKKDKNEKINSIICICTNLKNKTGIEEFNGIIHWISNKDALPAKFFLYDRIFNVKFPELKNNFLNYINNKSLIIKNGFVNKNVLKNKNFSTYQFEREGYFLLNKSKTDNKKLKFNRIVSLKQKWKK
ncbi:glutamine--tRNA ligase/YqeY domain fusion protein [Buchnera aphidicola]|uniref:glutamine--tRNA ligase/YqeY domain fusion protein n=1 Tax=Buchnera aphidicola TaxID=9 RepID=UPI0031B6C40B